MPQLSSVVPLTDSGCQSGCTCAGCECPGGPAVATALCQQIVDCSGRDEKMSAQQTLTPWPEVEAYCFSPLLARLEDKLGWGRRQAEEIFSDTKRFLYLCGTASGGPFAPPEEIDECWHHFILFTQEYASFCQRFFGRFLHHRPRYPDDPPGDVHLRPRTYAAAQKLFGQLSASWSELSAQCCEGSTNCQDAE